MIVSIVRLAAAHALPSISRSFPPPWLAPAAGHEVSFFCCSFFEAPCLGFFSARCVPFLPASLLAAWRRRAEVRSDPGGGRRDAVYPLPADPTSVPLLSCAAVLCSAVLPGRLSRTGDLAGPPSGEPLSSEGEEVVPALRIDDARAHHCVFPCGSLLPSRFFFAQVVPLSFRSVEADSVCRIRVLVPVHAPCVMTRCVTNTRQA